MVFDIILPCINNLNLTSQRSLRLGTPRLCYAISVHYSRFGFKVREVPASSIPRSWYHPAKLIFMLTKYSGICFLLIVMPLYFFTVQKFKQVSIQPISFCIE